MRASLSFFILLFCTSAFGQTPQDSVSRDFFCGTGKLWNQPRGTFYFAWGYNKDWYSKTDVRVHDESGDYDFTIHNLKAHDHPHFNELFDVALSIPQYGYRIGYWMPNQKYGVEIKFDHAKYIVYADQYARVEGKMNESYVDTQMVITDNFMHLEHTDGANFLMFNVMRRTTILQYKHIRISGEVKFGAGMVVPRSDVTLFGQRWNHCFHVAGWITGAEAGVRIELFKYFFLEPSVKGGFANYKNVLAIDDILISHRFWTGMVLLDAGFQFPMGKPMQRKYKAIAQPAW